MGHVTLSTCMRQLSSKSVCELKKVGRLSLGLRDDKKDICLNRIIWCFPDGAEYDAGPRQAEKLIVDMQLSGI